MNRTRCLFAPCVGLLLATTACPVIDRIRGIEPEESETGEIVLENEPELIDEKLRAIFACRDGLVETLDASWSRYEEQVDPQGRPRRRRDGVFVHAIGNNAFRTCDHLVDTIADDPPHMPEIEESLRAAVATGHSYAEHTQTLSDYLESGGWESDDWVMLQSLHRQLSRAYADFETIDDELVALVDSFKQRNDAQLLVFLGAEDRTLEMHSRALIMHAREFQRCITADTAPEPGGCDASHEAVQNAAKVFATVHASDPDSDKVFWMSTFATDAGTYANLARDSVDQLSRGRLKDTEALRDAYADLTRGADTLNFDFP